MLSVNAHTVANAGCGWIADVERWESDEDSYESDEDMESDEGFVLSETAVLRLMA